MAEDKSDYLTGDEWTYPCPRYLMLDVWVALGCSGVTFEDWIDDPQRTPADAWSQLMAAIRGDLPTLLADTNPPAGVLVDFMVERWADEVDR